MLPAQDYKRIGEGDTGPNTGGMGAYAPVSRATDALMERVRREILQPTLAAMAAEGKPFRGLLYAGLMLTAEGPKVVEFNCRFGDPETQAVLPLLQSSLLQPMLAVARGESLAGMKLQWRNAAAVTTVLASEGYPNSYTAGRTIRIPPQIEQNPDVLVFHAGTTRRDDQLLSSGGRVLAVTALAPTVKSAAAASIRAAGQIDFEGRYFRRDIAWREMAHSGAPHAGTAGS
jgi:phosphoribosylamine--glycine ligase